MARHNTVCRGSWPRRLLRIMGGILGLALMLAGLLLFLMPSYSAWNAQREMSSRIDAALMRDADADPSAVGAQKQDDQAYEYLAAYNRSVVDGTAGAVNDPFGIGSDEQELGAIGLEDAIVGSVTIPSMNVRIPVYLGATDEHMALGAAVISGTSAPLGGEGGNCVLAAHRGEWGGIPMFRDIESVREGDVVVVETPWDVLVYRATEFKVIVPTDTGSLARQSGRDLVTLFTCHPYGSNYQRYLVICERDLDAERAYLVDESVRRDTVGATSPLSIVLSDAARVAEPCTSPELRIERILRVVGLALFVVMLVMVPRTFMRPRKSDDRRGPGSAGAGAHFK